MGDIIYNMPVPIRHFRENLPYSRVEVCCPLFLLVTGVVLSVYSQGNVFSSGTEQ